MYNWKKWIGIYGIIAVLIYGAIYYYAFYGKTDPYKAPKTYATPTISTSPLPSQNSIEAITLAREDLAKRLGINSSDIAISSQRETMWPNSSLGCPESGKMYTQAVVPGYSVVLSNGENNYQYHTSKGSLFVLCTKISQPGEHCGGFIANANQCTHGYICKSESNKPDIGGTCVKKIIISSLFSVVVN